MTSWKPAITIDGKNQCPLFESKEKWIDDREKNMEHRNIQRISTTNSHKKQLTNLKPVHPINCILVDFEHVIPLPSF